MKAKVTFFPNKIITLQLISEKKAWFRDATSHIRFKTAQISLLLGM